MVVLEPATHQVAIVSAGHMAPMHRHADGQLDEPGADLLGFPLGVKIGFIFQQKTLTLAPRDCLLLYTDGIHECSNANNEMYGIPRIRKLLAGTSAESTPQAVGTRIVDEVRHFLGGKPQDDDMCLVCFGRI
jgi:sigma-B regulation protein RsbU (phosphoserine phosphatase)